MLGVLCLKSLYINITRVKHIFGALDSVFGPKKKHHLAGRKHVKAAGKWEFKTQVKSSDSLILHSKENWSLKHMCACFII